MAQLKGGSTVSGYEIIHEGNIDKKNIATKDGNIKSADTLKTPRKISISGDAKGEVIFDGSKDVDINTIINNSGVNANTYRSVTVNSKGIVTAGTNPTSRDGYGLSDVYTKNEVDNNIADLEIGGVNLYKGTKDFSSPYWTIVGSATIVTSSLFPGHKAMNIINDSDFIRADTSVQGFDFSDTSKTWTISAYFWSNIAGQKVGITVSENRINWQQQTIPTGKYTKLSWTFNGDGATLQGFRFETTGATSSAHINITCVKIEEGDKATTWRPAIDDIQDQINDLYDKKVDKISGKSLSTNDFNNTYKSKLDGISNEATIVEKSTTNGNIKINGKETNIYTHPVSGVTQGTYKSVSVDVDGHITNGTNPTTLSGYGITDALLASKYTANDVLEKLLTVDGSTSKLDADVLDGMQPTNSNTANTIVNRDSSGNFSAGTITASLSGNASSSTKLQTTRNIGLTGDISGSGNFDGTSNLSIATTLSNSGVSAGTYKSVTVDAKGRVKSGTNPTTRDGYGLSDVPTKTEMNTIVGGLPTKDYVANAIDDVQIGGVNLYKGTKDLNGNYWSSQGSATLIDSGNYPNSKTMLIIEDGFVGSITTDISKQGFDFSDTSKTWTISANIAGTSTGQKVGITISTNRKCWQPKDISSDLTSVRMNWTFTGDGSPLQMFRFETIGATNDKPIYINRIKVEEGNKATAWSPAPEDTQSQIDDINTTIGSATLSTTDKTVKGAINEVKENIPTTLPANGGDANTAQKFKTARNIALTGDVTGNVNFDGSSNASIATTLTNSGVNAGTYRNVTVDTKGRVTAGTNPTTRDGYGLSDVPTKTEVDNTLLKYGIGGFKDISNTDLNNLLITGLYSGNVFNNAPSNNNNGYSIIVINGSTGYCRQIAINTVNKSIYYRLLTSGTWSDWTQLANKDEVDSELNNKVDKISGKSLSTNDFDATYKSKLDGIANGATTVAKSTTNGNIKINGTETNIYTHPGSGTNPHGTTKSDIGLSNVTNDAQVKRVEMNVANGVATTDANNKLVQDAKTLGGLSSDKLLRSDVDTTANGLITANKGIQTGKFKIEYNTDTTSLDFEFIE